MCVCVYRFRLEDEYLSIEISKVPGRQIDPLYGMSLKRKENIGNRKKERKQGRENGKQRNYTDQKKKKKKNKGERDYTDENNALCIINYL